MYIPIGLSFSIHRYLSPCHVHEIMNRSFGPQRFAAIRARNPGDPGAQSGRAVHEEPLLGWRHACARKPWRILELDGRDGLRRCMEKLRNQHVGMLEK